MISIKNWSQDASEKIIELLKTEMKWPLQIVTAEESDSYAMAELKKYGAHKFDIKRSLELLVHFPAQPERVQLLECMDSLLELNGKLWPDLLIVSAIKRALRRKIKTLDLNQSAYVVGEGVEMRPLIMVATEFGFSKICLVSKDKEWLEQEKKFLSRRLVGIQFDTVVIRDLTLQPQDTNLLLNCLNLEKNKEYLQDLAYFNFMVSGGVVVDLFSEGAHQTLQEEVVKAQLSCIKEDEVLLAWWLELIHKANPTMVISKENEKNLFEKLETLGK